MGLFKKKQAPWKPKNMFPWPTTHALAENPPVEESAVSALLVKIRRDAGVE